MSACIVCKKKGSLDYQDSMLFIAANTYPLGPKEDLVEFTRSIVCPDGCRDNHHLSFTVAELRAFLDEH